MKRSPLLTLLLVLTSCSGMKVLKEPPPREESKPGVTMNGRWINGGVTVEKVGYWCDAKHGMMTFGEFGPTEPEARSNAQASCHRMFKDSPCAIAACKPAKDDK